MRSIIKTVVLAAVGAAIVAASPASAQTKRKAAVQTPASAQLVYVPAGDNNVNWQAKLEYLKDYQTHIGGNY